MRSFYRWSGASLMVVAALLLSLSLGAARTSAQTGPSPNTATVLTIAAGQTAQVQVRGFCLDFGLPFPNTAVSPKSLGSPELRAALNYAIQKGYVDSDPAQVEQAMWFLSDGTWHATAHQIGQEIVDNSKTGSAPSDPSNGTMLFDAIAKGGLTADITFTAKTSDHFYGDGTLTIKNTGSSDVQVYLPIGTVFPPVTSGQQRLLGYAMQVTQQAATATVQPSATAQATATEQATATAQATVTAAATETTAPTVAAAPTETAMPAATATTLPQVPTTGVQQLPTTGSPMDTTPWWLLLAGFASFLGGVALLRRAGSRA